jgi:hypothetical protein
MPGSRGNARWIGLDAHRPKPWRQTTRCIFCGMEGSRTARGSLTNEHVYSNWTRRFVPRSLKNFKQLRATARSDRTHFLFVSRPGDIRDGKSSPFVKIVTMDGCGGRLRIALGQ